MNIKGVYFISKETTIKSSKKMNLCFISLLNLFLIKNTQEYVYHLLKYNSKKIFTYPFYIKSLRRVIKFLQANQSTAKTQEGEKVKKIFLKIFPELFSQKSINLLISNLNSEKMKQLSSINIYNSIEPDFINYISSFSKYDKHLSNSDLIQTRLKNSKLINTNIFTITRFIDDEYNNLINGKYCFKCYLDINKCICKKKAEDEFYYDNEDEIDIDFDTDYYNKNKIEYDSTKCKGVTVKRKPKSEEVYEDPITNLIGKNKDEYTNRKEQMINSKANNINISSSQYGTNTSCGTNYNSRILNTIKNNILNESDSLNNSNNIAKIKAIYHQNNSKKKENLILIKNNENNY
jgi:hypothetical protein